MADHSARPRWAGGRQRHRQIHSAEGLGGLESLDYGSIISAKNTTFGYLPQDGLQLSGRTVFDECMSVFDDLRALEQEMEELAHKMGELDHTSSEYAQVADRYQRISGEFRVNDGYALDSQVGTVLDGLGFRKEDWTRHTEEFSGGWQMRIALAKLLLAKPNLLLLDEPTNHLDLETRNWLEAISAAVSLRLRADLARPLLPRCHRRHASSRSGTSGVHVLQRQLREVSAAEAGAPRLAGRRLQEPARAHRAA